MSCIAVKVVATFSDEAKRIASASLIGNEVSLRTLGTYDPDGVVRGGLFFGITESAFCLARFDAQAEADLFVSGVKMLEANPSNGFTSLVVKTHVCCHEDQQGVPCVESQIWP